jgi:hypothetical protein
MEKKIMSDPIWDEQSFEKNARESILTSKWFTIGLAGLSGIIGLIILYYLFYPSSQSSGKQYVIGMGDKPFKEKPENPGGIRFPHQDKMVYENLLSKQDKAPLEQEEIFVSREPENPIEIMNSDSKPCGLEKKKNPPLNAYEITPVIEKVIVDEPVIIKEKVASSASKFKKPEKKRINSVTKSMYQVQLAALPSKKRIEYEWRKLSRQHKNLLGNQKMTIEAVTLPKKGPLYRLRVGSFKTHAEASVFCETLKQNKVSCFAPK